MRRPKLLISITLFLFFCQSCLSTGRNFPSHTDWIIKNTTKKSDVRLLLGTPYSVGSSGGTDTWSYAFYRYEAFGETAFKELKFYWNKNSSVKHYTFTTSFAKDRQTAHFQDLYKKEKQR